QDGAEERGRDDEAHAAQARERSGEHDAPYAAPEGEGPEHRNAERRRRREGVGSARRESVQVQHAERALMEDENGERAGDETAHERARHVQLTTDLERGSRRISAAWVLQAPLGCAANGPPVKSAMLRNGAEMCH